MPEAIAEVREMQSSGKWSSCGTAFVVSRQLALTAFHVIGDRTQGKVRDKPLQLRFLNEYSCGAKYTDGDGRLDFALLTLDSTLPADFEPIALTCEAQEADGFVSRGFPPVAGVDILTISGNIRNLQATIFTGVPAIQLFSHEAGAEMPLGGMSGAPVLVGSSGEQAAIGLIRWNPTRQEYPTLSVGGTLFACPIEAVVEGKPELRALLVQVPTPLPPAVLHNLPFAPNPLFTGRKGELEALRQGLQVSGQTAVTHTVAVHGLGGVGKTQLAIQYAWEHLREFDAVLWTRADSRETFEAGLAALAPVLRLPEAKEREQGVQVQAVLGWLRDHHRWLLIADNADTEAAVWAVEERLSVSLPGAVLLTSRLSRWPVNMPHLPLDILVAEDAACYLLARVREEHHEAGDEATARELAQRLGYLPLALEQSASFVIEMRSSFGQYQEYFRNARPELLKYKAEGTTRYPAPIAKTWSVTLERLSPLARALLRLAAWFAPEAIPRRIFRADEALLAEALDNNATVSAFAIETALGELHRFSLIRLAAESVSVHRLLQAAEQDALAPEQRERWLLRTVELFSAFAPDSPQEVGTWGVWLELSRHAETLLEHTKRQGLDTLLVAGVANALGLFLDARAAYAEAAPLYERALEIREKVLGPEHLNVAESLNNLAGLYRAQGQYEKAAPLHERALKILQQGLGPDHPIVARSLNNLALLYGDQAQYAKAESLHQLALVIREKAPDHLDLAGSLNNLAGFYRAQGQYGKAEPLYQRALAIFEKALGPDHPDVATSLNNLALLYDDQAQNAQAESFFQRALAIREKALGTEHPDVAASLNNLAALYNREDQYGKAESLYQRALAIREKVLGPEHLNVAESLNNLALLYHNQAQYGKAEPLYQRALAIFEETLGLEHPDVATSLNNLAGLYDGQGQYGKAEPLYQRALAIREKALGPEHPDVATSLNNLAEFYRPQGQYERAEPLCQRALAIRKRALGSEHPKVAQSLNNLALLYLDQGQYGKAEPLFQRALAIWEKALGPDHPRLAASLNNLARLYSAQGQYRKAEPLYQRALGIREKALGPEHPNVATCLDNYALLLRNTDRPEEAATLESRAKAIRAKHA